ncbi:hypothetical protein [Actinoallomurus iriomotensis]|uniref:hypothetical protein n=1 Tax=Actinoallomurus iriomotensis TaxID=478107 RepID=UPI0025579587|nr:hypothetical protein [Actinoallomurus iriomotensis]
MFQRVMRGGVRVPAAIVAIGMLAGCSDPAGAVRRERTAARKASPSPSASASAGHQAAIWWQAPGGLKTASGLRVHTGALRSGRMRVAITDVAHRTHRTITATTVPHGATIGQFTLTGIKIAKSPKAGTYGVTFHYRQR